MAGLFFFFSVIPSSFRDASEDDLRLWLPQPDKSVQELDVDMSLFLLTHVGDQFCWMVQTEKEAKAEALAAETEDGDTVQQQIAWKRVVQGVREMCDVCETTLFNFHWACGKCGYVVCIDCYKTRKAAKSPTNGNGSGNKDDEKEVTIFLSCSFVRLCVDLVQHLLSSPRKRIKNVIFMVGCTAPVDRGMTLIS